MLKEILLKTELDIKEYDYLSRLTPRELEIQAPTYFNGNIGLVKQNHPGYSQPYYSTKLIPIGRETYQFLLLASFRPLNKEEV